MSTNPSEVSNDRKDKIEKLAKELNDLLNQEKDLWNNKIKPTLYKDKIEFNQKDADKSRELTKKIIEKLTDITNSIQGLKSDQFNATNFPILNKLMENKIISINSKNNLSATPPYKKDDITKIREYFPPLNTQLNQDVELNKLVASINKDLERLNGLLDLEKDQIILMNRTVANNEKISESTVITYQNNGAEILKLANEIAKKLQNHDPEEIEFIKQKTNNFNSLGVHSKDKFVVPALVTESEATKAKIEEINQEMREKQVNQLADQLKIRNPELFQLNEEFNKLNDFLKTQLAKNNNDVEKLPSEILKRITIVNNTLRKAADELNKKLDALNPTENEIQYIASKVGYMNSNLVNNRLPYPHFDNEHLEKHFNTPSILTEHTTQTVLPNQDRNATVNLTGRLISNDWVHNKELAEAIRKAMKEAIIDAVKNDPQFKPMNLTLTIKKIDLSTPQHPSSNLKGIEVTSNDPDKKINFTATPESVTGNGNTENLKAMSIEIVKNLETRINIGATGLKINLGDCEPESVKNEFSELINKQLKEMLERNQNNSKFSGYSMDKLQLPVTSTPTVNAVITSTNQATIPLTQQSTHRLGSNQ